MGFSVTTIFKAKDGFSPKVKTMEMSVNSFAQKAEIGAARADRAFRKLTPSLGSVGRQLKTLVGITAVVGLLNLGSTAAINYDKNLQELSAITGVTGAGLVDYEKKLFQVSKAQKVAGDSVLEAAGLVGSAKPELLANADALALVTDKAILLSKAAGMEIPMAADSLTKAMNMFNAGADQAAMFTDILATSQQKGTARIDQLSEALVNSGSVAHAAGLDFMETNVALQALAKGGIVGSQAGTALSGVLSRLAAVSDKKINPTMTKFSEVIQNLADRNLTLNEANKLVGKNMGKNLLTLVAQNKVVQELDGNLNEVGNAQAQADIKSLSLANSVGELSAAFQNAFIETSNQNGIMNKLAIIIQYVTNNLDSILKLIVYGVGVFAAFKAMILLTRAAIFGYNVVLGITGVLSGKAAIGIGSNTVALGAYKVATALATAATWLFNSAWWANPVVWIVAAIVAAIVGVIALIMNWTKVTDWLAEKWQAIGNWFRTFDFVGMFRKIGASIIQFMLFPLMKILELVAKVPGKIGDMAQSALDGIDGFVAKIEGDSGAQKINSEATKNDSLSQNISKSISDNNLNVRINDTKEGRTNADLDGQPLPINVSPVF